MLKSHPVKVIAFFYRIHFPFSMMRHNRAVPYFKKKCKIITKHKTYWYLIARFYNLCDALLYT